MGWLRAEWCVAAFVAAATPARSSLAAPEPAPTFRLSLVRADAAGSCPGEREIARWVIERLGRDPFADGASQSIEGTLSRDGDRWSAELRVRDEHGIESGRRSFDTVGSDCIALADAVTLAVALVIDPDAALRPGDKPPPERAPLPPPLAPEPPPLPAPVRECPPHAPCSPPAPQPSPLGMRIALRGVGAVGVLPGFAPGVGVAGSVGDSVRALAGVLYLPEVRDDDPRFAFGLTAAFGGACGRVASMATGELSLCGALEVGAIHAVVSEIVPRHPGDRLWLAAAIGPELSLEGPGPLLVGLGVELLVPLYRPSFEVRGFEGRIFQSASAGGVFHVALGAAVP